MMVLPIHMPPVIVHIHADRRLAFQVLTAFGNGVPLQGASTRVLERDGGSLLVEFHTGGRNLFGRPKTYRTVERVTLSEPSHIEFEGIEVPVSMLRDRFELTSEDGCTRFTYRSTFGVKGWIFGWLLGLLLVRPIMRRLMVEHTAGLKQSIEQRAQRSKVYPQRPCARAGRGR